MASFKAAMQQTDDRHDLVSMIPLQTPLSMQIELSSACNFRCVYCMHHNDDNIKNGKLKIGNMTMETFQQIVDELSQFPQKLRFITLQSRGESLINKEIVQMLRLIKKREVADKIGLYTNGSLLSKEISDGLIEAGLDVLHVSIAGYTKKQCEKVTGVMVDVEGIRSNVEYFYKRKNTTYLYVKSINYDMSDEERRGFLNEYREISDNIYIEQPVDAWKGAGIDQKQLSTSRYGLSVNKVNICPRIFFACVVHYDGTVVACDHDWSEEYVVGNVKESSIKDLWNGERFKNIRNVHLSGLADTIERCRECVQRKECLDVDNIDSLEGRLIL